MNGHAPVHWGSRRFSLTELGPENPLPMVGPPLEQPYRITGDIPREIIDGSNYGNPANLYPYRLQDGYSRRRSERELQTITLENDRLRAVFLPELGGRLWELFDKRVGKQLLYTPSTIQLANLALRNAWFAGGIEWNIGTRGHSPTTCSPLHASTVRTPDGRELLRMWEFDRLREVVFQIDAWLPLGAAVLSIAVRIKNPNAAVVPMYWWTNAAIPEDERSRIVAPAGSAFASDESNGISRVTPTDDGGTDCTWPTHNVRARDFFFDLPPGQRPWILNADQDGDGLAMLSTARLRGRKLFVWGRGAGGRRWQEWLSPEGGRYAEIQAGLATTQFQHLAMPAGSEWSWVEAYGNARVDASIAHDTDWKSAVQHCEDRVESLLSQRALDESAATAQEWAALSPDRPIVVGTGWGALEALRRKRSDLPWVDETAAEFPAETIGEDQLPWAALLDGSGFPGATTFVTGADWEAQLRAAEPTPQVLLHLATMRHAAGELDAARGLYLNSLSPDAPQREVDALAWRGLALIALSDGRIAEGVEYYRSACALDPDNIPLLVEAATAGLRAGAAESGLELFGRCGTEAMQNGRVRFLYALILARAGHRQRAAQILTEEPVVVADLREGEDSIATLWKEVFPGQAVPSRYSFSMK